VNTIMEHIANCEFPIASRKLQKMGAVVAAAEFHFAICNWIFAICNSAECKERGGDRMTSLSPRHPLACLPSRDYCCGLE
jgi:hypothetical protein